MGRTVVLDSQLRDVDGDSPSSGKKVNVVGQTPLSHGKLGLGKKSVWG